MNERLTNDADSQPEAPVVTESPYRMTVPCMIRRTMISERVQRRIDRLLAQTMAEPDLAGGHFQDALEFCRTAGYIPELAWACSDYAELILDRDDASKASGAGDRSKAIELQDDALIITQELGMRPLTERILARREILRA